MYSVPRLPHKYILNSRSVYHLPAVSYNVKVLAPFEKHSISWVGATAYIFVDTQPIEATCAIILSQNSYQDDVSVEVYGHSP